MPQIDLSGILSTFLSAAQADGSVTKGLVSEPEKTVEKATGSVLSGIDLKTIVPIAISILSVFAMKTGQAKSNAAAEEKVEAGTLDLTELSPANILGGLDLSSLLGGSSDDKKEEAAESTSILDSITDSVADSIKDSIVDSVTSSLLGGKSSSKSTKSDDSNVVGDILGSVLGSVLKK